MEEDMVKIKKWMVIYLAFYCILVVLFKQIESQRMLFTIGIMGLIGILIYLFLPYKRKYLFCSGIISALMLMHMGIWTGGVLETETVIGMGAAVSAFDVLSFTRLGKRTINAKVMSKPSVAAKLVLYGKEGKDELIPTCGMGDLFLYALWITGIGAISNTLIAYSLAALGIFLGTLVNGVVIDRIHQKRWFKGFPATIIPFSFTAIIYIVVSLGG